MRLPPAKPPRAWQRGGDEDRSIVRAVVRDCPSSRRELDTRTGIPRLRFGPLGFCYRDAMRIVHSAAEIKDADRSHLGAIAAYVACVFDPGDLVLDPFSGVEARRCHLGTGRDEKFTAVSEESPFA